MSESVWLERPSSDVPWGFRLHGGRDFHAPLSVQKITGGSVAASRLQAGDVIVSIADAETASLTHAQAMQFIKDSGNTLQLGISRLGVTAGPATSLFFPQTSVTSPANYMSQSAYDQRDMSNTRPYDDMTSSYSDYPFTMQQYPATTTDYQSASSRDDVMSDSWTADEQETSSSGRQQQQQQQQQQPTVPDAVINMAAKAGSDKKPFAYIADVNDIRQQRDRVRRRQPVSTLPRYQHVLNLPQFDEQPPARSHGNPPAADVPGTDTAMVSNLQFNSPLDMYSRENVVEALKGQTGGNISSVVGLPKTDKKSDITQSAVYKMIHDIDQPRPRPRAPPTPTEDRKSAGLREPTNEELKFTGLNQGEIPSKSFQRLQSMTGTGEEPGEYEQKSIRYTGRNIPSRSFRILQSMTGGDDASPAPASDDELSQRFRSRSETPQRPVYRSQGQVQGQGQGQTGGSEIDTSSYRHNLLGGGGDDDVADYDQTSIRYTGRHIPSRSFRMLQHLTGGATDDASTPPPVPSQSLPRKQQLQQPRSMHQSVAGSRVVTQQHGSSDEFDAPASSHTDVDQHQSSLRPSEATSEPRAVAGAVNGIGTDTLQSTSGRRVKVVRLRQQASVEDQGATEF